MACVHAVAAGPERAVAAVNGAKVALTRAESRRAQAVKVCAVCAIAAASVAVLAAPAPAMAWGVSDAVDDLTSAVNTAANTLSHIGLVFTNPLGFAAWLLLSAGTGWLKLTSIIVYWTLNLAEKAGGIIGLSDFNHLVTAGADTSAVKAVAEGVCNYAIKPICGSILSLVMLSKLMKMSQRIDGTQTMPALKEVIMLAVEVGFAAWLVSNAFPLCSDIFDLVNSFASTISRQAGVGWINFEVDTDALINEDAGAAMSTSLILFVLGFIMMKAVIGCTIDMYKGFIARGLQIYLYAAFSPLLMCFLWIDETRQWAMGFIKGFVSCALSGVVIYFGMCVLPYALAGVGGVAENVTAADGGLTISIANSGALFALLGIGAAAEAVKQLISNSGQYARDILGG